MQEKMLQTIGLLFSEWPKWVNSSLLQCNGDSDLHALLIQGPDNVIKFYPKIIIILE